jgi:hypothetical protein
MRSRFKSRMAHTLASVFLRYPASFLLRVHFSYFHRCNKPESNEFITEEFDFDTERFNYRKIEGTNRGESVTTQELYKTVVKKEFDHFLSLVRKSGFVYASCGHHFDHEGTPRVSQSRQYELRFSFAGNKNPFLTIEKFGDEWYGLDYPDLEKFEVFENYLESIARS